MSQECCPISSRSPSSLAGDSETTPFVPGRGSFAEAHLSGSLESQSRQSESFPAGDRRRKPCPRRESPLLPEQSIAESLRLQIPWLGDDWLALPTGSCADRL